MQIRRLDPVDVDVVLAAAHLCDASPDRGPRTCPPGRVRVAAAVHRSAGADRVEAAGMLEWPLD